jgi:serine/threonine protein kinase/tetratricopeptide (TPR) repeat protein
MVPAMIGQTLGHYRVVEEVGRGGMGVVYRAHDLRLDRDVALKVIRPGALISRTSHERFRREALLLSKLSHPHIAQVYDFDEEDGVDFLIMEYVKGTTLAQKITDGPIPEETAILTGTEIASALGSAAEAGIVHRDLKPSNTMLTSQGGVKLLDFGLARLLQSEDANVTESVDSLGGVAGTLPYMSPEQLKGEPADFRSDVYSLGALLYEASTGHRPFDSSVASGLICDILNKTPVAPRVRNPNLSPGFESIIQRCLAKEPAQRYKTASEVRVALESLKGSGATQPITPHKTKSISLRVLVFAAALLLAIWLGIVATWRSSKRLPKVNAAVDNELVVLPVSTSDSNSESLAFDNGLVETLTSRLTHLGKNHPLFQVVPASEVRAKGVANLQQARDQFGATLGLQVNVERSGSLVRVNYAIVDARQHRQVAGDTITATASDPFSLEDKVAESIVKSLEIDLEPTETQVLTAHGTDQPSAFDFYLQGRGYLQEPQKRENLDSAITVFHHALERDPKYALAVAGLGEAYWRHYELDKENRWASQAQTACEKAIAMDSNQAESHACLAMVYSGTGRYDVAVKEYQYAVDIDPTSDEAVRGLATAYAKLGRTDEAEKTFQSAITLRPQYWRSYSSLGAFYINEGRYEEAAKMFSRVVSLSPDSFRGYSNLGATYIRLGQYQDAVTTLQNSINIRPTEDAFSNLGTAFFSLRKFDSAAQSYAEAAKLNDQVYVVWGNLGDAYYYSGKRREAAVAYQKAVILASERLKVNPRDASVLSDLSGYYAMLGKRREAYAHMSQALQLSEEKDAEILFEAAMVNNQFGETSAALKWLRKARAANFSSATIADAPALDNLHSNAEFQVILKEPNGN